MLKLNRWYLPKSAQCSRQLGAAHTDAISVALAAGCLCSKIGNLRQAETLLLQAFTASKAAAEVRIMKCATGVFWHAVIALVCRVDAALQGRWNESAVLRIRCLRVQPVC